MAFELAHHYSNQRTRAIMKEMLGNMKPDDVLELISDPKIKSTDVPQWVELTLRQNCKIIARRLRKYDSKIIQKFGRPISSLVKKLKIYNQIWDNWDGQEPFPYPDTRKIKYYFDDVVEGQSS